MTKTRAQRLVPFNDPVQTPFQRVDLQLAFQQKGSEHVIHRTVRVELMQKPQSLLGKRQWARTELLPPLDRGLRWQLKASLLEQLLEQLTAARSI
jgi:hypothetical protein